MKKILDVVMAVWFAVVLAVVAPVATAALPASIGTAITAAQTDGLALADLVWPALIALAAAVLLFKLFKRFFSKI